MYPLWQMRQGLSFDDSAASKGCRGSGSERMAKLYRMRTLCGRLPYRCSRTFLPGRYTNSITPITRHLLR